VDTYLNNLDLTTIILGAVLSIMSTVIFTMQSEIKSIKEVQDRGQGYVVRLEHLEYDMKDTEQQIRLYHAIK